MVTIKFRNNSDVPAFMNFRTSVLEEFYQLSEDGTDIRTKVCRRIKFLNEKLKEFNAVYTWCDELPRGRTLEFASEEDYAYFILKWS